MMIHADADTDPDTRVFVLLTYGAFGGGIKGKTKLQKLIYFLGVKLGFVETLGYRAHYYGPYSAEVANLNADLKSLGYLEESVAGGGAINPQGFEVVRYDYKLTSDGKKLLGRLKISDSPLWRKIQEAADAIKKAGDPGYLELSIAAKAYFILQERKQGKAEMEEIQGIARSLGWKVTKTELKTAVRFLERFGLVRCS